MPDLGAEEAELELNNLVEQIQKKWNISNQTMNYLLGCLAQDFGIRAAVDKGMEAEGE